MIEPNYYRCPAWPTADPQLALRYPSGEFSFAHCSSRCPSFCSVTVSQGFAPKETTSPAGLAALLARADALLLDFNGTLSDDEELLAELFVEVSNEELGIDLSRHRYFTEFLGHTEEYIFGVLAGTSDAERLRDLVEIFNQKYLDRIRLQRRISDAAIAFVRAATRQGKAIAVVTAASRSVVQPALDHAELLPMIDALVAYEDVARSKPEPDCYLRALELLGVDAERAIAFEDSPTGFAAANAADLPVVMVGNAAAAGDLTLPVAHSIDALTPELLVQ
ncbi:beta-phosphoglucomutase [Mycobacterium frederiksbergense]|uniref:Beta-phosphoglucomutase n=1 Tax=Mycolicibacterium frederiksbergense TaxID=117567 RepID=A0ABT6L8P4_9MYCO|nr:HAD family phosphatase [Mycolicibacterium frederiksbergense]MDH6199299.1 beta-phosphoglucomutase [Mycolicibacterium frederiksbergense]